MAGDRLRLVGARQRQPGGVQGLPGLRARPHARGLTTATLVRYFEDSTWLSGDGGCDRQAKPGGLTPAIGWRDGALRRGPDRDGPAAAARRPARRGWVWSWAPGEPRAGAGVRCVVQRPSDGRWELRRCSPKYGRARARAADRIRERARARGGGRQAGPAQGPAAITSRTTLSCGWLPKPVRHHVAPGLPGLGRARRVRDDDVERRRRHLGAQLGQCLGAGQVDREQAVPARARRTGLRLGQRAASHTGMRLRGRGWNSPSQ